jgi:hypothetical protein
VREKYRWLVARGWFVLREKYCWLTADKPNEQASLCTSPFRAGVVASSETTRQLIIQTSRNYLVA